MFCGGIWRLTNRGGAGMSRFEVAPRRRFACNGVGTPRLLLKLATAGPWRALWIEAGNSELLKLVG
jgi:hypothetical protein